MINQSAASLLVILLICAGQVSYASNSYDLEHSASSRPRGRLNIPEQWFEMETVLGWEKMMLIFGYADNRAICKHLMQISKKESPNRKFRCADSN